MAKKTWGICDEKCDLYKICEEAGKSSKCAFVGEPPIIKRYGLGYTNKQAAEALKIRASTIQHYTDIGLIIPEISNPSGRGTRRIYSHKNLIQIQMLSHLVKAGCSLNLASSLLTKLSDDEFLICSLAVLGISNKEE